MRKLLLFSYVQLVLFSFGLNGQTIFDVTDPDIDNLTTVECTLRSSDNGNDAFRLTIKNWTQGIKFSIVQQTLAGYPAHRSSAEWIVESPGTILSDGSLAFLPLADFNTITFNDCKAEINGRFKKVKGFRSGCRKINKHGSHIGSINNPSLTFDAITMITQGRTVKAFPSSLSRNGESFTVTWGDSGVFPYEVYVP